MDRVCNTRKKLRGAFSNTDIAELDHSMIAVGSLASDRHERRRTLNIDVLALQSILHVVTLAVISSLPMTEKVTR